ncbi:MAG: hypothetical protein ACM3N0_06575 [Chloroflexota bacterium]
MSATLTIDPEQRDALHGLMLRRLLVLAMEPRELARAEGVGLEELCVGFGEDLRLMEDVGWARGRGGPVELTMAPQELARALRRLRDGARRAPGEARREREPQESEAERRERFRHGERTCEELLARLGERAG